MNIRRETREPKMDSSVTCPTCGIAKLTIAQMVEANKEGYTPRGWTTPEDLYTAFHLKYAYPANYVEQKKLAYGRWCYYCYRCGVWRIMPIESDKIECLSCSSTYKLQSSVLKRLTGSGCLDCFDREEVRLL